MTHSKTSSYYFLSIDSLFEAGRMFVGAISVAYMLKQGVSLEQIASLKIIQSIVFILSEVPTGVIADTYGRKTSLFLALLTGFMGFLFFYSGNTFYFFVLGEVFAALSICFWSGAFEAYALDHSEAGLTKENSSIFFHRIELWSKNAVMLSGFIGGLVARDDFATPYLIASLIFLFIFFLLLLGPKELRTASEHTDIHYHFKEQLRSVFSEGVLHPSLRKYFVFMILVQFYIQPLLHYWQPFFLHFDSSINGPELGRIFFLYCASTAVGSWLTALIIQKKPDFHKYFGLPFFILFLFSYGSLTMFQNINTVIFLFCLTQMFLAVSRSQVQAEFSAQIPAKRRASVFSGLSLISRFGMIASLSLIQLLSFIYKSEESSGQFAATLFYWFSITGLLTFGLFILSRKLLKL